MSFLSLSHCCRFTLVSCGATSTGTSRANLVYIESSLSLPHFPSPTLHQATTPHPQSLKVSKHQSIRSASLEAQPIRGYKRVQVRTSIMNGSGAPSAEEKARAESRRGRQERKKAQQRAFRTGVWDKCRYRVPNRERYCAQPRSVLAPCSYRPVLMLLHLYELPSLKMLD